MYDKKIAELRAYIAAQTTDGKTGNTDILTTTDILTALLDDAEDVKEQFAEHRFWRVRSYLWEAVADHLAAQIVGFGLPGTQSERQKVMREACSVAYEKLQSIGIDLGKVLFPQNQQTA